MALADLDCQPIPAGAPPLLHEEALDLMQQAPAWSLEQSSLARTLRFPDFPAAMAFVNRVAETAQAQQHHPDICISYNEVRLTLSTHKIGGLSMNDFIMAAKIDRLAG